ncbi:MAG: hydantoinase/oxoprolinase family protein [Planctomycetota bacterium]
MRTLGVDTGGTFTDVVLKDGDRTEVAKLPSTPDAPARAVLGGLELLGGIAAGTHVVHGTTVALNALLTGRTAPAALVAGEGFADLLEIGRQERPDIYDLFPRKPRPLVPRELRFEVGQRSWPDPDDPGKLREVSAPATGDLERLARRLRRSGAQSVAVCLLHSYADPRIEADVAAALAGTGLPITTSAGLLAEHREVERFSTAVVNAVLVPLMRDYLGPLEGAVAPARLSILQSSGGTLPAERAALEPVRVLLSGPAGGVVGAARAAVEAGFQRLVGLDMGGTSTDVAFHDARGEEQEASAVQPLQIAGYPIGVPSLDIHTIGCGGGSLVTVDSGGVLHVGPESAGADPGPVCYGRSDRLTVTDAHVQLGHIASGTFLGGELELDVDAVARAFERLGKRLGVSARAAAEAVLAVARAAMRRAIGVMTMQRGEDPARLPLVAFGGAGGLQGAALAASLGMEAALVPRYPGALSAAGMASADALRESARSPLAPLADWPATKRRAVFRELDAAGRASLRDAGHRARDIRFEHRLDLRYRGQSFELRLADAARVDPAEAFHRAHERLYGYRLPGREIQLVCLRSRAVVASTPAAARRPRARKLPADAVLGRRRAVLGRAAQTPVVARDALAPGTRFEGPALVQEYSGTTLVPPGAAVEVTRGGHLLIRP